MNSKGIAVHGQSFDANKAPLRPAGGTSSRDPWFSGLARFLLKTGLAKVFAGEQKPAGGCLSRKREPERRD